MRHGPRRRRSSGRARGRRRRQWSRGRRARVDGGTAAGRGRRRPTARRGAGGRSVPRARRRARRRAPRALRRGRARFQGPMRAARAASSAVAAGPGRSPRGGGASINSPKPRGCFKHMGAPRGAGRTPFDRPSAGARGPHLADNLHVLARAGACQAPSRCGLLPVPMGGLPQYTLVLVRPLTAPRTLRGGSCNPRSPHRLPQGRVALLAAPGARCASCRHFFALRARTLLCSCVKRNALLAAFSARYGHARFCP